MAGTSIGKTWTPSGLLGRLASIAIAMLLSGCATFERPDTTLSSDPGVAAVRFWTGDPPKSPPTRKNLVPIGSKNSHSSYSVLALSGGGPDGAYGAGLLAGWQTAGSRPNFDVVTGVSTGALMAPFVFLGPDYDDVLRRLYTGPHLNDVMDGGIFVLLEQPGLYRTQKVRVLMDQYITPDLMAAIAVEHRRGRRLYIATGSLDAQRSTGWDMGAIATRGTSKDLRLFRNIMIAAMSVPVLFPPVALPVAGGSSNSPEMHVDAGQFSGFYADAELFPPPGRGKCGSSRLTCHLYVLIHNKLLPEPKVMPLRVDAIGKRAVESIVKSNLTLALHTANHEMHDAGVQFHAAYLRTDAPGVSPIDFNQAYMQKIYREGYEHGGQPDVWRDLPTLLRRDEPKGVEAQTEMPDRDDPRPDAQPYTANLH
jgi:hypothetical protein